jgi:hypothetical protein
VVMKNGQIAEVSSPEKHTWGIHTSTFVISFDPFNVDLVMVVVQDLLCGSQLMVVVEDL